MLYRISIIILSIGFFAPALCLETHFPFVRGTPLQGFAYFDDGDEGWESSEEDEDAQQQPLVLHFVPVPDARAFQQQDEEHIVDFDNIDSDENPRPRQRRREEQTTELIEAVQNDEYLRARELILDGVDIHETNGFGATALHVAATYGNLAMVQLLVANGANPNRINPNNEETPLDRARMYDHLDCVEAMQKDADN